MTADTLVRPTPAARTRTTPTTLRAGAPALLALSLTMLVEMVDGSILNVALPTIGRDLHVGVTGLQWVVGAYSLTFGGLLLIGGTLGNLFGRRRVLLAGLAGFGLSSAVVVLAHSTWQLIAVRALCGACAAVIAPGTMSLVFRLFDDTALRNRAIGVIVSVAMLGFAVGPALGGLALEHVAWQALLVVSAPVAAVAFWGVQRGIAPDDPADRRAGTGDVPGALLSVTTVTCGLLSLTFAVEHGWLGATTLLTAAVAVLAGTGFVLRERRAEHPMVDLALLARPAVRGGALLQTSVMVAMVGVAFAVTQLFQFVWGWSPLAAGLGTLPLVAGMFLATPLTDVAVARLGHRRTALAGSAAVLAALLLLITWLDSYLAVAAGLLLLSGGMRLVMVPSAVALLEALPEDHTSFGSALNDTAQELGNAVGVAVVGTVTAAVLGTGLPSGRWSAAFAREFLHGQRLAFAVLAGLVAVMAVVGGRTLTDSTTTEEH